MKKDNTTWYFATQRSENPLQYVESLVYNKIINKDEAKSIVKSLNIKGLKLWLIVIIAKIVIFTKEMDTSFIGAKLIIQ